MEANIESKDPARIFSAMLRGADMIPVTIDRYGRVILNRAFSDSAAMKQLGEMGYNGGCNNNGCTKGADSHCTNKGC